MADNDLTSPSIPQTLKERLRSGKVIPFIGAGVSMTVLDRKAGRPLFPSWRELLERAASRLEREQRIPYAETVRGLLRLDKPDYLDAARRAREGLGEAIWFQFLKEELDYPRERISDDSLSLAQAIWNLQSNLLITTNYDDVLEWASEAVPVSWDIEAHAEMAAFLHGGMRRRTVWHLHGSIHNASKIILTRDGYSRLYPEAREDKFEETYQAALHTLRSVLSSYTFLFIGFSLDDAYFGMQLEGVSSIFQGATGPHYVLVRRSDLARGINFGSSIRAFPFDDFGEPLLKLVQELGELTAEVEPERKSPETRLPDYGPHHHVFFVPFRQKGDQVIGREAALQAVRQQLTQGRRTYIGQTAAFQGLGGLGKTQLAVEYAYRFQDTYPNGVIWINADQDIDAQLTELAEKARWIAPKSEHKFKLEVAQQRLRTYSDCLIIFDNLEDPEAIRNYLPEPQANPHILVTSRKDQPDFNPVPLDTLDENLSEDLLVQEANKQPTGDEETKAMREIARSLGGLPLALELAGAYLRHRQVSWQQYRDLLSQNLKAALPSKFPSFTQHEADLYSTLKINEEILKEEPRLREILDLLTWSGSSPMGISLMSVLLGVQNPVDLTNALGLGTQLRMLQKTPDAESYSIHRLVSEVRREDIALTGREAWVDDICQRIGDWFQNLKESFSDLLHFEAEIDHLRAWQEHASNYARIYVSRLIWLQGYPPSHRGDYRSAKEWVEIALNTFEQGQEGNEELKAHLLNDLGVCNSALGSPQLSLEYMEKALTIRREILGDQHADTATSFNNIGSAYNNLGDDKQALDYHQRALTIRQELFGEKHPAIATSFNNIGNAYNKLGDYKQAIEYARKALTIQQELFGGKHPAIATSFNNIGSAYDSLGDHKQALDYHQRALAIQQELFGEKHPDIATSFNNIGSVYVNLGDYKQALEYGEKARKLSENLLGDYHPDTILFARVLASTQLKAGRPLQALKLLEELVRNLPKEHSSYSELKQQYEFVRSKCHGLRQSPKKKKGRKAKRH